MNFVVDIIIIYPLYIINKASRAQRINQKKGMEGKFNAGFMIDNKQYVDKGKRNKRKRNRNA